VLLGLLLGVSAVVDRLPRRPAPPLAVGILPSHFSFQPVSINQADRDLLMAAPGIGPALAERIVAARRASGGFQDMDQLAAVPGIGPAKLAVLRQRFTVP